MIAAGVWARTRNIFLTRQVLFRMTRGFDVLQKDVFANCNIPRARQSLLQWLLLITWNRFPFPIFTQWSQYAMEPVPMSERCESAHLCRKVHDPYKDGMQICR